MGLICGGQSHNNDMATNDKVKEVTKNPRESVFVSEPFTKGNVVISFKKYATEEYQDFNSIDGKVQYGKLFENSTEHPLVQKMFYLVADQEVDMDGRPMKDSSNSKPYWRISHMPIYGMCQPNNVGLKKMLDTLSSHNTLTLLFNLREEPVLLLSVDEIASNAVSYSIREKNKLFDCVIRGLNAKQANLNELAVRKEILNHAGMEESCSFCFYNSTSNIQKEPHKYNVQCEDFLITSDEMYSRIQFDYSHVRYHRLTMPLHSALTEEQMDQFVSIMKTVVCDPKQKTPAQCVFVCRDDKDERSTTAMVMCGLLYGHMYSFPHEVSSPPFKMSQKKPNYERGEFQVIKALVTQLQDGLIVKHQVDVMIDLCSDGCNLRQCIVNAKNMFDTLQEQSQPSKEWLRTQTLALEGIERYFYLICFNAYLAEQSRQSFSQNFSDWMLKQPNLYRLLGLINLSPKKGQETLKQSLLIQDSINQEDQLVTLSHMGVANFHKMSGLPLYGMAQPASEAILKILDELTKNKKHSHVIFVNLRNDLSFEGQGKLYHVVHINDINRPLLYYLDKSNFSETENLFNSEAARKHLMVIKEEKKEPEPVDFPQLIMSKDTFKMAEEKYPNQAYYHVPLPSDYATNESVLDDLMCVFSEADNKFKECAERASTSSTTSNTNTNTTTNNRVSGSSHINSRVSTSSNRTSSSSTTNTRASTSSTANCKVTTGSNRVSTSSTTNNRLSNTHNNNNSNSNNSTTYNPAFCFFCSTGIERTTFAMAAASLHMYQKNGFPIGTRPGEQERVSIADAEFTMGNFLVVKHIVMLLPDGHQLKREVDFVLDKLFETMSTTHFHLREMILVTYNMARRCSNSETQKELYSKSVLMLERYIYLILFNAYLRMERNNQRKTFQQWMNKDAQRVGVYKILNDIAFYDIKSDLSGWNTLRERWRELNKLKSGEIL